MKNYVSHFKVAFLSIGLWISLIGYSSPAYSGDGIAESVFFYVNDYSGGGCSTSDMSWADDFENTWDNYFAETTGSYSYDDYQSWGNIAVDVIDFMDPSYDTDGRDYVSTSGTDWADAPAMYGHGSMSCLDATTRVRKTDTNACTYSDDTYHLNLIMGDNSDDCSAGMYNNEIDFGDEDANVFVAMNCYSSDRRVWLDGSIAIRAANEFNTLLGSHGHHHGAADILSGFDDFLAGSEYNQIGLRWVVDKTIFHTDYDDCATAVIWGASSTETNLQYSYGGFNDLKTSGSGMTSYYYVTSCDPGGGPALPS